MAIEAVRHGYTVIDVIDRVLDKGLVINADISVFIAGTELLGIRIKAAIASFETAAKYGLEFPAGARLDTPAWRKALKREGVGPAGQRKPGPRRHNSM
jgi:L-cysteine desulfidase